MIHFSTFCNFWNQRSRCQRAFIAFTFDPFLMPLQCVHTCNKMLHSSTIIAKFRNHASSLDYFQQEQNVGPSNDVMSGLTHARELYFGSPFFRYHAACYSSLLFTIPNMMGGINMILLSHTPPILLVKLTMFTRLRARSWRSGAGLLVQSHPGKRKGLNQGGFCN